ncbi:hypothetical protein N7369_28470 [Pseudomonas otitidis]|nr:hypothetical protein [Pseudomonas otitidis]MDH0339810.1 hypothetical protein [Pseudomonas otitidis]
MAVSQPDLLNQALARDALGAFLLGEPPYFHEARAEHEEPQNFGAAFEALLLPYWRETADPELGERLTHACLALLAGHPDHNRAIYCVHAWIWEYRYAQVGKGIPLFDWRLEPVVMMLKACIERARTALVADTRWAGASWNGADGIWGALLRASLHLRDRLSGPDLVPSESE